MKKRNLALLIIIIILFLILISFFTYSRYNPQIQESSGNFNSLSNFLGVILEPFHLPDPWAPNPNFPYGKKTIEIELPPGADNPNVPIPDDLNNPLEPPDKKLPPSRKIDPNQKPTPAPPKIIYDFWKKFWELYQKLLWFIP